MKWISTAVVVLLAAGTVIVAMKLRKPASSAPSAAAQRAEANAILERLPVLQGYPFEVRYSATAREEAMRLADLTKNAYAYFAALFPSTSPTFTATYLAPADWRRGYGMPSYQPVEKRLRVATDDNPLWQSFGRIARVASPFGAYPRLKKTYADTKGHLQLRRFFDLLAVHELAHAFEEQGGVAFPTHWMREIYANLALHAFIAKTRPKELSNLTTLPEAQTRIAAFNLMMRLNGYTRLDDFDRHYPAGNPKAPMSDPNYGWYQVRFHVIAREMFDAEGEEALRRLWKFGQVEAAHRQRASDYFREHGTLSGWSDEVSATDLVPRLASEVSPRLAQAVSRWD
jgi:hypothetical protein